MIIELKKGTDPNQAKLLAEKNQSIYIAETLTKGALLVTFSSVKTLPSDLENVAETFTICDTDMQLSSKHYLSTTREINFGDVTIGGNTKNCVMITGPCSVEDEVQIRQSAELCKKLGVKIMRAGSYKPRTSPYSFQGLGKRGLELLGKMREEFGMKIITEVRDFSHVHDVIEFADIIQIGAKSMYDHGILKACGAIQKPVLIKRGFGTTLQEFVQASEFVLSGGNPNVILCERGIRTFETKTRFTFDLCGVEWIKEHSNLPIILDPSHAMGYAYGVANLARASVALGVDGLLIETHPNPKIAKSDASQQLNHQEFEDLYSSLQKVANAVGYQIV